MITAEELKRISPATPMGRIALLVDALNDAMREFEINTVEREAAFIAQVLHESGGLRYVSEIASGQAYEGRHDLGNVEPGDGTRFKGRGLIQITGRANYQRCGDALGLDLVGTPRLLEDPANACRSAAWFWKAHGLNELADRGDFAMITRRINGGTNGWQDRMAFWDRAKEALA